MTYGRSFLPGRPDDSSRLVVECPTCGMLVRISQLEITEGESKCPKCGTSLDLGETGEVLKCPRDGSPLVKLQDGGYSCQKKGHFFKHPHAGK